MQSRWWLVLSIVGGCHGATPDRAVDGAPAADAQSSTPATSTLTAETRPNTSVSSLFVDDYKNYNTTAQTGNGNGDLLPHAISKLSIGGAAQAVYVATQTWFCHLASNEAGTRLAPNARCGSHIDIGYNADDPAHVSAAIDDMRSRGLTGALMDWSGKDSSHDGNPAFYPDGSSADTTKARGSTEVGTNAIFAYRAAAEQLAPGAFTFAVVEDEGITNCRNGWAGGCACWPAYGATCNETSQVISDLNFISTQWATSPAYLKLGGKPAVLFFAPDYNACPNAADADCQHINWDAVHQFAPDQAWIIEGTGGYGHAYSAGGFDWVSTTAYPGSDSSYGVNAVASYDAFVGSTSHVAAVQHVVTAAFKGFDDAVTDGWNYGDGSHTRYIEQRCGQTWLATLAQVAHDFPAGAELLQIPTWDDYEEATEVETGIDTCVTAIPVQLSAPQLTWSVSYGKDLTGGASGTEDTTDHFVVWASPDGEQLVRVAPDLVRDATGALPHALDLTQDPLPTGTMSVFVQAVAKPMLANAMSAATPVD